MIPPPLSPLIRWAQQQLDLPAGDPSPARRQFLTRLPANGFVPSAREHQAIYVLIDDHVPRAAAALAQLAEEQRLRAAVDAFAASYFDHPPEQRRHQWQDLQEQCQENPPLTARLDHLSLGLDVEAPAGGRVVDQLAAHFCRLYVMPSHSRAMERRKLLWEMDRARDNWRAAFNQMVLDDSPWCFLEPLLAKRLRYDGQLNSRRKPDILPLPTDGGLAPAVQAPIAPASESPDLAARLTRIYNKFLLVLGLAFLCGMLYAIIAPKPDQTPRLTRPPTKAITIEEWQRKLADEPAK